jgi:hypothetical protein
MIIRMSWNRNTKDTRSAQSEYFSYQGNLHRLVHSPYIIVITNIVQIINSNDFFETLEEFISEISSKGVKYIETLRLKRISD